MNVLRNAHVFKHLILTIIILVIIMIITLQ